MQVSIRYVGHKPTAFDNVTRSGTTWNGHGDVQDVSETTARALLKHPDQWVLATPSLIPVVSQPEVVSVTDEDGDTVIVEVAGLKKPLERMSKAELKAFAKRRYNKELDARKSSKALIDEIEELENDPAAIRD
jgi:hypothetical protein